MEIQWTQDLKQISKDILYSILTHNYLMHVKCMDAHLSGGVLWEDQTGELTLPCTAAGAHSPGIRSTEKEYRSLKKMRSYIGNARELKMRKIAERNGYKLTYTSPLFYVF